MSTRSPRQRNSPLAGRTVLLCVTGGIAAYKSATLTRLLVDAGATVHVCMTESATRFVGASTFAALSGQPVHTSLWNDVQDVPHVRLAASADLVIVAPATANSLARFAFGMADELVAATVLETTAPVLLVPAMHTGMYQSPATQANLTTLAERRMHILGPATGRLAAGDEGPGRMMEPEAILAEAESILARGRDLDGVRVLITAGPTWEPIDAVRFVGNRSTGLMGSALASEAVGRGADVCLVLGPGTTQPPRGVQVVPVTTARDMLQAVQERWAATDVLVMAAAVADFRPTEVAQGKLKKERGVPEIRLTENPDILATVAADKGDRVIVGFAAETADFSRAAKEKLARKHADLLVVNQVGAEGTGFGSLTDNAAVVGIGDADVELTSMTKDELSRAIWDRVVKLQVERG